MSAKPRRMFSGISESPKSQLFGSVAFSDVERASPSQAFSHLLTVTADLHGGGRMLTERQSLQSGARLFTGMRDMVGGAARSYQRGTGRRAGQAERPPCSPDR